MHKYSALAREGAPWSVSKAETAIRCPQRYHYQYVSKPNLSSSQKVALQDTPLKVGGSAHLYAEGLAKGRPRTVAQRLAILKNKLVGAAKEEFDYLVGGVEDFVRRVSEFKVKHGIEIDVIEGDFAVDAEGNPCGYWADNAFFRWKVDRQLMTADGKTAAIIDLKTGKSAGLQWATTQLNAYAYGAFLMYPGVEEVRSGIFSAVDMEFQWMPPYKRGQETGTEAFLEEAAAATTTTEAKTGRHCSWCPYQKICPAKQ